MVNQSNSKLKIVFSATIAVLAWLAIITQYYLSMINSIESGGETTIRFFSYFTILTNLAVAIYFTIQATGNRNLSDKKSFTHMLATPITIYISCVGLVYQILLRKTWNPEGLQMVTDELLHSVIPLLAVIYWVMFENTLAVRYKQIPKWLLYPTIYLIYCLIRGYVSGFYPYPFINVSESGMPRVLLNSLFMTGLFFGVSAAFIAIGKRKKYTDPA